MTRRAKLDEATVHEIVRLLRQDAARCRRHVTDDTARREHIAQPPDPYFLLEWNTAIDTRRAIATELLTRLRKQKAKP